MPLYEYQCESCGRRFEKIQKFSDPLVETCPTCGGPVHKLVSSPAFHLKGTGWYATDYPNKGKAQSTDADKSDPASASGDAEKSSKTSKDAKESKDSRDSKDSKDSKESTESKDAKAPPQAKDSSGAKESGASSSKGSIPPATSSKS